jgi:beta-lactamase class A
LNLPDRRALLRASLSSAALLSPARVLANPDLTQTRLAALERRSGARIGVAAMDNGNTKTVLYRASERFVMCSTFKLSLAAAILAQVDRGEERLDRLVRYDKSVPIGFSPATSRNIGQGMTVAQLCEAAIIYSDNGAANLLLAALGGPSALTAHWRGIGDDASRLDDTEPKLNIPDGVRNTTTPAAMLADMQALLLGNVLSAASRNRLLGWMHACTTGANRLRAGLPPSWQWGDKTGTGPEKFGLVNDIGIATPPGRKPILMVCYTSGADEKVLAAIGKIFAEVFA